MSLTMKTARAAAAPRAAPAAGRARCVRVAASAPGAENANPYLDELRATAKYIATRGKV